MFSIHFLKEDVFEQLFVNYIKLQKMKCLTHTGHQTHKCTIVPWAIKNTDLRRSVLGSPLPGYVEKLFPYLSSRW